MPITLGCPSCAKRFRARDESAGKKVKCPYCQAAVDVPSAEEAATAAAPTVPLPPPDSGPLPLPPSRPLPPPTPKVATPADWGALPGGPPRPTAMPAPLPLSPPPPPFEPDPLPPMRVPTRGGMERPKSSAPKKTKPVTGEQTPEEILVGGWASVRRGLFWVQFALFWLALLGGISFGKMMYERAGNELPTGEGWLKIEGYVNTPGPNAIRLSKADELNLLLYGVPLCLAGLAMVLGRLIAGGAPRSSGARGLFACSGLFGLVGFAALLASVGFDRLLMMEEYRYARVAFLLLLPLAEFWFLTALTASGVALKRPRAARAVGALGFAFALAAFIPALGWDLYTEYGRPKLPDADLKLYEQAALMLGWLLLVCVYWRAVRNVRSAAREFLAAADVG